MPGAREVTSVTTRLDETDAVVMPDEADLAEREAAYEKFVWDNL